MERRVTAALLLLQDVDLGLELGVRSDRTRLGHNHTALNLLLVDTAEQQTYVVAGLALVEQLAEHLDTGAGRRQRLLLQTDDLDGIAHVDDTGFDTARYDGTAAGDREHVLDRHQERLLVLTLRDGDILVDSVHELHDLLFPLSLAVQTAEGRTADDGGVVAVVLVLRKQVADLHLDQVEHLGVVHHVALVQENNDTRHVHLTGEQHVLVGLGHRTVRSGNYQDGTVHLSGTRYHVLHIVGVARAVYVSVVAVSRLVLDVRGVDRDTALLLLGCVVDRVERTELRQTFLSQNGRDSGGKGRLTVVDVTDGTDVHMRFRTVEFFFCHSIKYLKYCKNYSWFRFCNRSGNTAASVSGGRRHRAPSCSERKTRLKLATLSLEG